MRAQAARLEKQPTLVGVSYINRVREEEEDEARRKAREGLTKSDLDAAISLFRLPLDAMRDAWILLEPEERLKRRMALPELEAALGEGMGDHNPNSIPDWRLHLVREWETTTLTLSLIGGCTW